MDLRRIISRSLILAISISLYPTVIVAERISDITNTKHNLSVSGPGTTKAVSETQICVFCHTPHQAEAIPGAPLWNRKESGATYTPYLSSSINASDITAEVGGSSKLCLSCHDGTIAIGSVNVANGALNVTINMAGTGTGGVMPSGAGDDTGFTRKIGNNLTNDHPISFTYDDTLANTDGELRPPSTSPHIANRGLGVVPGVPLENDQVQCTSCHDPHIRDSDIALNIKFLRLNRFQLSTPGGGTFDEANDIICVACHDKLGLAWANSAHADPLSANETYSTAGANLREFPANLPVWQGSCLNCHDTHAVQGTRRLVREGTDSPNSPKTGGESALEEACYTCHSSDGGVLSGQGGASFEVPNIKTDFTTGITHMPITNSDQNTLSEIHDVNDSDLLEDKAKFNVANRHVECTDCHNPHRVLKNRLFNNTGGTQAGTHDHSAGHTNIASGVLRGSWGVEPSYSSASFDPANLPLGYNVKSGDGGNGASTSVASAHVTREYQVCLRCHSSYAYGSNPPFRGDTGGNTSTALSNGLDQYTDQAMEFQAPSGHEAEGTAPTNGGWDPLFNTNNHRSWHPVMQPTGRTLAEKTRLNTNNFEAPWNGSADIGNQTMYCSDCHGSDTANGTSAPTGGENGNAWGPHGSNNNFILKGGWSNQTGRGNQGDLCFKCHDYSDYTDDRNDTDTTGFCCGGGRGNLHAFHQKQVGPIRCNWCHVAVPHGWKNKAFLVNLNDVGPEAGEAAGTEVSNNGGYSNGPYYNNAMLKVYNFANSGQWSENNCGSRSTGVRGKDWMGDTCSNPP